MTTIAIIALLLAAWPALLFVRNLGVLRRPFRDDRCASGVSILIPARNETRNIAAAVHAALANVGTEVLVLDDASMDNTAEVVLAVAAEEPRLELITGARVPHGWCGKNWACAQLAEAATHPLLLFVDADVRLASDAAASIAAWLRESGAQLASGVPRQEVGTFSERLLIPLIDFVLLGFLPLRRMRRSPHPAYATGCGQLVIADANAYRASGGHGAIRSRMHDGLALPKAFRTAGYRTDLFDATESATCRMYGSDAETWQGFSKNTHEGLGAPSRILPATVVLLGGQVLPFVLLLATGLTQFQFGCALAASALALLPRILAAWRFQQRPDMVILHPIAVVAMLGIQWMGLIRYLLRRPTVWKDRGYSQLGDRVSSADAR